jgi:hypothetical protein
MIHNIFAAAVISLGSLVCVTGGETGSGGKVGETPTTQPTASVNTQSSSNLERDREAAQDRRIHQFGLEY